MSVSKTTVNTGFFKRIGNWFNKNGDTLGKSMQLAGTTAMGVGFTGMMFHEMNKKSCHHQSIFGGGFGGCCSPWNMGMWNMGGCGMFGGMSMLNNMYGGGMTNPYLTMMGMQSASNFGFLNAMASRQNMYANPMNNPLYQSFYNQSYQKYQAMYNDRIDFDTDVDYTSNGKDEAKLTENEMENTDKGEKMDTAFNGKKTFTYIDDKDASEDDKQNARIEYAKSYVAYVDSNEGNGDGLVSEDEFVEHEATNNEFAERKAFKQFDLNNDGNLDYKEFAALLREYDGNNDGKITSDELSAANKASQIGINSASRKEDETFDRFRKKLNTNYNNLA